MSYLLAWSIFLEPMPIYGRMRLLMLLPLALSVSIVYKTIRCRNTREIPMASLMLCVTIVVGMFAVGIVLWAAFKLLA